LVTGGPGRRPIRSRPRAIVATLGALVAGLLAVFIGVSGGGSRAPARHEHDVTEWAAVRSRPLSDAAAAALVTPTPENRPENRAANDYVPTRAQLAAFYKAQRDGKGVRNPLAFAVTGRPGLKDPSTDDLIQWVSHKWGIPTDLIRAQISVESYWRQTERGDTAIVDVPTSRLYPSFARIAGTRRVYESVGIAGEKWLPDGTIGAGTARLRWDSTAFNLDYYAATLRYYYDGYCSWCTRGYHAGEAWGSVGAWFSPNPWDNAGALQYIGKVKAALAQHVWAQPGF
jgi:hypothetical protein